MEPQPHASSAKIVANTPPGHSNPSQQGERDSEPSSAEIQMSLEKANLEDLDPFSHALATELKAFQVNFEQRLAKFHHLLEIASAELMRNELERKGEPKGLISSNEQQSTDLSTIIAKSHSEEESKEATELHIESNSTLIEELPAKSSSEESKCMPLQDLLREIKESQMATAKHVEEMSSRLLNALKQLPNPPLALEDEASVEDLDIQFPPFPATFPGMTTERHQARKIEVFHTKQMQISANKVLRVMAGAVAFLLNELKKYSK